MKKYRKQGWVLVLGSVAFLFACVTVNIYFPAEKVESVAGEIVEDVRGGKNTPSEGDKSSQWGKTLFALLDSTAWAQDATTVSNPTIRALKEKLKTNYEQMKPFYQKGMVKEGGNGYVSAEKTEALNLKEKRELNSLIDAENRYRRQLYEEVAKALKIDPSQLGKIADIFAKEWQKSVR